MELIDVHIVELLSFILGLISLLLVVPWIITHKKTWGWVFPALVFFGHLEVFYFFVNLENLGLWIRPYSDYFTIWSAVIRLQGIFSFFAVLAITIPWRKIWKYTG